MTIEIGFDHGDPVVIECESFKYDIDIKSIKLYEREHHYDFKGQFFYKYFYILKP